MMSLIDSFTVTAKINYTKRYDFKTLYITCAEKKE